ncbi:hypothetical protein H4S02_008618 [Coemansia sp. RSA 2611]|nr:hypothetical protein H4S02_008618 [Coemansia sp. RSA 2611]KAJ2408268.1 hypothetical protein GGI10_004866 [Coemansia sp. RSA 2530]KAJ2696958.1 hypothetical protein H4218_004268 [Coemansia sp. IMI 209128]
MAPKLTLNSTYDFRVAIDGDDPIDVDECKLSEITVARIVNFMDNNAINAYIFIGGQGKYKYVVDKENMNLTIADVIAQESFDVNKFVTNIVICLISDDYSEIPEEYYADTDTDAEE